MHCVSQYKFFGPHAGILYGRADLLDELFAYKVRPAPDSLPGRFESGGMVRVGPVQSNTLEEVSRLREALRGLV